MSLVQLHGEVPLQQRREAERLVAEELRADGGVDQVRDDEPEVAVEDAEVVVAAVQHLRDRRIAEELAERVEANAAERIDDEVLSPRRHLNEADLVEVRVQRIGLGIDRDLRIGRHALHRVLERRL